MNNFYVSKQKFDWVWQLCFWFYFLNCTKNLLVVETSWIKIRSQLFKKCLRWRVIMTETFTEETSEGIDDVLGYIQRQFLMMHGFRNWRLISFIHYEWSQNFLGLWKILIFLAKEEKGCQKQRKILFCITINDKN